MTVPDWGTQPSCYLAYYVSTQCPVGDRNKPAHEIFFLLVKTVRAVLYPQRSGTRELNYVFDAPEIITAEGTWRSM